MTNTPIKLSLYGFAGGITLILAGCGGGSSDSGFEKPSIPSTPAAITSTNQNQVVAETSNGMDAATGGLDVALGAALERTGGTRFSAFDFASDRLTEYARQGLASTQTLPTGVAVSETIPCDSGNFVISANISDPNSNILNAGDSFSLSFTNCKDNTDGSTINGSVTARLSSGSLDMSCDTGCADATMSITFNDIQITGGGESAIIDGDFTMSRSGTTETISGTSFYVFSSTGEGMHLTNFSVATTNNGATETSSVSMTIASTHLNGSVTIETTTPLVTAILDEHPSSGVIVLTGNDSKLRVTALDSTSVQLELDADNDGSYEESATVTWSSIEQS